MSPTIGVSSSWNYLIENISFKIIIVLPQKNHTRYWLKCAIVLTVIFFVVYKYTSSYIIIISFLVQIYLSKISNMNGINISNNINIINGPSRNMINDQSRKYWELHMNLHQYYESPITSILLIMHSVNTPYRVLVKSKQHYHPIVFFQRY